MITDQLVVNFGHESTDPSEVGRSGIEYTSDQIQEKLINALRTFYTRDKYLLEKNVNERSMTHKIAEYLQAEFLEPGKLGWNVDCEYNRNENHNDMLKKLKFDLESIDADNLDGKTVYPDIIVHQRGKPKNLLVIEVKRETGGCDQVDLMKLKAFMSPDNKRKYLYKYKYAIFLRLGPQTLTVKEILKNDIELNKSEEYCKALNLLGVQVGPSEVWRSGV